MPNFRFAASPSGFKYTCVAGSWSTPVSPVSCAANACDASILTPNNANGQAMLLCKGYADGAACPLVCKSGYAPIPANSAFLCSSGQWNDQGITMQCSAKPCNDPPILPDHADLGSMRCANTASGASCLLECEVGYSAPANARYSCFAGAWSTHPYTCTPFPCNDVPDPGTHADTVAMSSCGGKPHGDICRITCAAGYESSPADSFFTCALGSWTAGGQSPSCQPKACHAAPSGLPQQANVTALSGCAETPSSGFCALKCNVGHSPNPPTGGYTCTSGSWQITSISGFVVCSPDPCDTMPSTPPGAALVSMPCTGKSHGGVCTLVCEQGYHSNPNGAVYTCSGGQWSPENYSCDPSPCSTAPGASVSHHNFSAMSACKDTESGAACPLTCETGYYPDPPGAVFTCSHAIWDDPPGYSCHPKPCDDIPSSDPHIDLSATASSCVSTPSGSSCEAVCEHGYIASATPLRFSCTKGTWSPAADAYVCNPQPCLGIPPYPSGADTLAMDSCARSEHMTTCPLVCLSGTTSTPSGALYTCSLGDWDSAPYACLQDPCPVLPCDGTPGVYGCMGADQEAMLKACPYNLRETGDTCEFICKDGYTGPTAATITCDRGSWLTGALLQCIANNCTDAAPAPGGADVAQMQSVCSTSALNGESCPLSCLAGYSVSPGSLATCTLGNWTTTDAYQCTPNPCAGIPMPPDGLPSNTDIDAMQLSCSGLSHGSSCALVCLPGYTPGGGAGGAPPSFTCSLGVWSDPTQAYICAPDPCKALPAGDFVPHVNEVAMAGTCLPAVSESRCYVRCMEGYHADPTDAALECIRGNWSWSSSIYCEPDPCSSAPTPPEPLSSVDSAAMAWCAGRVHGQECPLVCAQQHLLSPEGAVYHCDHGSWYASVGPEYRCISPCMNAPAMPAHAISLDSCAGQPHGSTCVPSCLDGYELSFPVAQWNCEEGTWVNSTEIVCAPAKCAGQPFFPTNSTTVCPVPAMDNTKCELVCIDGFHPEPPSASFNCSYGTWSSTEGAVACIPDSCDTEPNSPINSNITACHDTMSGEMCALACIDGFHPEPVDASYTCYAGEWFPSHTGLICQPNPCSYEPISSLLPSHTNPTLLRNVCGLTPSGQTCPFPCAEGYVSQPREASYHCYRGSWTDLNTSFLCEEAPCEKLPVMDFPFADHAAMGVCLPTQHQGRCALACLDGYEPSPVPAVYTCSMGKWVSDAVFSCQLVAPGTPVSENLAIDAAEDTPGASLIVGVLLALCLLFCLCLCLGCSVLVVLRRKKRGPHMPPFFCFCLPLLVICSPAPLLYFLSSGGYWMYSAGMSDYQAERSMQDIPLLDIVQTDSTAPELPSVQTLEYPLHPDAGSETAGQHFDRPWLDQYHQVLPAPKPTISPSGPFKGPHRRTCPQCLTWACHCEFRLSGLERHNIAVSVAETERMPIPPVTAETSHSSLTAPPVSPEKVPSYTSGQIMQRVKSVISPPKKEQAKLLSTTQSLNICPTCGYWKCSCGADPVGTQTSPPQQNKRWCVLI